MVDRNHAGSSGSAGAAVSCGVDVDVTAVERRAGSGACVSDSSDVDLVVSSTTIVAEIAVVGVHPCSNATAPLQARKCRWGRRLPGLQRRRKEGGLIPGGSRFLSLSLTLWEKWHRGSPFFNTCPATERGSFILLNKF